MIDTIIFDLGNVLIDIHGEKSIQAFEKLGAKNFAEIFSLAAQSEFFDRYEKGLETDENFRQHLQQVLNFSATDHEIDEALFAMVGELTKETLTFLQHVCKKYRIFLMSNTNSIHIRLFHERLNKQGNKSHFLNPFEKVYYSFQHHMRKPDEIFFKHIILENELNPQQTLFVDDNHANVQSAKRVGLNVLLMDKTVDLWSLV